MRASPGGVLAALAGELDRASELCDRLETLVSRLVRDTDETPHAALDDAQTVDALAQHIAGLATFTRTLADQGDGPLGGAYDVDPAIARLTLADLAARLGARAQNLDGPASGPADTGELQLF
jgi:hypothetical protein